MANSYWKEGDIQESNYKVHGDGQNGEEDVWKHGEQVHSDVSQIINLEYIIYSDMQEKLS